MQHFWRDLFTWWGRLTNIQFPPSLVHIMFGIINENEDLNLHTLNFCILYAKEYIHNCKIYGKNVRFDTFKCLVKKRLDIENCIYKSNNNHDVFIEMWETIYTSLS